MKPPVSGKKYLLYARVSPKGSTWSAEETSIAVQFEDMRSFILRHDSKAEFVEVFDEFKSGKNLNRGGVQRILSDLDRRPCPWHCLVVWNLDRLCVLSWTLSRSFQSCMMRIANLYPFGRNIYP